MLKMKSEKLKIKSEKTHFLLAPKAISARSTFSGAPAPISAIFSPQFYRPLTPQPQAVNSC